MAVSNLVGYPSKWKDYQGAIPQGFGVFEFVKDSIGDVARFGARYRAASCFQGITLSGYSQSTEAGYSALTRVMFTWSAFETLLAVKGKHPQDANESLERHGAKDLLAQLQTLDKENKFYNFIYERVNESHKKQLDNYFNGDPCNIAYLASAIRHIFAHGWLSPNADAVEPKAVVEICNLLCDFLLSFMDNEFSLIVEQGLKEIRGEVTA